VLSHDRRRIEHVGVTRHPTAEWTAQQVVEAFPYETPTFLVHDRDAIYGDVFRQRMKALGITELVTPRRCPWRNGFCERVIGTIRRECTDHVIALGERHLSRVLREYVAYYNRERTHTSLDGNAPEPRVAQALHGDVIATPVLGGLHHAYRRAA